MERIPLVLRRIKDASTVVVLLSEPSSVSLRTESVEIWSRSFHLLPCVDDERVPPLEEEILEDRINQGLLGGTRLSCAYQYDRALNRAAFQV